MLFRKTSEQVIAQSVKALQDAGVITNLNPGGVARSLIEIVGQRIGDMHSVLALNMAMRYISTAAGVYLDLLGESMGVGRLSSTQSSVDADDRNIRFFVTSGRLKDSIPDKVIPRDTQITSNDGTIVFVVTEDAFFNDVDTEVYVSAESSDTGTSQNVGPGVLTNHDLGAGGVSVTNTASVNSATDVEDDESYRFRLSNARLALQQANPTAIRISVMSIPEIADVQVREYAKGVGTYEVLLVPTSSTLSFNTIRRAQEIIDATRAAGVRVVVREPDYIPVEVTVALEFRRGTPDAQKARIRQIVRRNIIDYVDDIPMGGTLVINELRQRVMQTDEQILDMRITCLSVDRRPQLLVNIPLAEDELFILDPDADDPISVS